MGEVGSEKWEVRSERCEVRSEKCEIGMACGVEGEGEGSWK